MSPQANKTPSGAHGPASAAPARRPPSEDPYASLRDLARSEWGLNLAGAKASMAASRISRGQPIDSSTELPGLLRQAKNGRDRESLLNIFDSISTSETSFFRHPEQFEILREHLAKTSGNPERTLWSAGCSVGCEPYSLAIAFSEWEEQGLRLRPRILATDLSRSSLATARRGVYEARHLRNVKPSRLARHFVALHDGSTPKWRIRDPLTVGTTFGLVNLMGPWRMQGPFDAILCRNVMIHFTDEARRTLMHRFGPLLQTGGLLFVGNTECESFCPPGLERIAPFCFRRI